MLPRTVKTFDLRYKQRSKWHPIPNWAKYLISLGAGLATARSAKSRIVATISVPTSSFAAAFISLGRILDEPVAEPAASAVEGHFGMLSALPQHTPLIYFNGGALYNGPFLGIIQGAGQHFISMATQKCTFIIPKKTLPHGRRPARCRERKAKWSGRSPTKPKAVRRSLLFPGGALPNPLQHQESVTIVGEKNRLREELVQAPFAIPIGTGHAEGVLQDLIRVGNFSSGGIGSRASVYARSRDHIIKNASAADDELVVLDGAVSHFRWVHKFTDRDTITILSKTEPEYAAAVDSANNRYLTRQDDLSLSHLGSPPAGIDLMLHTEERQ